eukprot:1512984-Prymnesium_polylepis.1
MDDIEDIQSPDGDAPRVPPSARGVRARRKQEKPSEREESAAAANERVPGAAAVWVKTYGCSHNHSDSEYMCGLLAQYGYRLVPEKEKAAADLWLVNSCT